MFRKLHQISVSAFLYFHWQIFSTVHSWVAFRTIFRITCGFPDNFQSHKWISKRWNKLRHIFRYLKKMAFPLFRFCTLCSKFEKVCAFPKNTCYQAQSKAHGKSRVFLCYQGLIEDLQEYMHIFCLNYFFICWIITKNYVHV